MTPTASAGERACERLLIGTSPELLASALDEPTQDAVLRMCAGRLAHHGDFASWYRAISALPSPSLRKTELRVAAPHATLQAGNLQVVEATLRKLGPWKKGPFRISSAEATLDLDAEWRSELKWARVLQLEPNIAERRVMDVGTGNGYFLYRLRGDGAQLALGLEPALRSVAQFLALQAIFREPQLCMLPLRLEEVPFRNARFDTVLSMGVIYHHRAPAQHLAALRTLLPRGGQLVLESIVVPGPDGTVLKPSGRYAQMPNVRQLPSRDTLLTWLGEASFHDFVVGEVVTTTSREQRRTEWMAQPSLEDYLEPTTGDPDAADRTTVEGHPRPARVVIRATAC